MIELQSKCTHRNFFGVMGSLSGVLGCPYFGPKITKMPKIGLIWDPLKSHSMTPEHPIFFCGYILTVIQSYFTEKRFEGHVRPKNVNFHKFLVLYSGIRAKLLHKSAPLSAIWVLGLDQNFFAFSNYHTNV